MRRLRLLILLSLVTLVVLIPPGMCPCLLVHGGMLSHTGLPPWDMSPGLLCRFIAQELASPPAVIQAFMPTALLLALLGSIDLWRLLFQLDASAVGWQPLPLNPPPR